jgi:hypothetical protein
MLMHPMHTVRPAASKQPDTMMQAVESAARLFTKTFNHEIMLSGWPPVGPVMVVDTKLAFLNMD